MEFNTDEKTSISFEVDKSLLDLYNEKNSSNLQLLPENAYSLPENYQHLGVIDYQDLNIEINASVLKDQTSYGLPLRIKSAGSASISEIMPSVVLEYCVEDLAGWYTVDWLPKTGRVSLNILTIRLNGADMSSEPEKQPGKQDISSVLM